MGRSLRRSQGPPDMSDLDNLEEIDLRPEWNHATKVGKMRGSIDAARAMRERAIAAARQGHGHYQRKPKITLPAISIQKRDV